MSAPFFDCSGFETISKWDFVLYRLENGKIGKSRTHQVYMMKFPEQGWLPCCNITVLGQEHYRVTTECAFVYKYLGSEYAHWTFSPEHLYPCVGERVIMYSVKLRQYVHFTLVAIDGERALVEHSTGRYEVNLSELLVDLKAKGL